MMRPQVRGIRKLDGLMSTVEYTKPRKAAIAEFTTDFKNGVYLEPLGDGITGTLVSDKQAAAGNQARRI